MSSWNLQRVVFDDNLNPVSLQLKDESRSGRIIYIKPQNNRAELFYYGIPITTLKDIDYVYERSRFEKQLQMGLVADLSERGTLSAWNLMCDISKHPIQEYSWRLNERDCYELPMDNIFLRKDGRDYLEQENFDKYCKRYTKPKRLTRYLKWILNYDEKYFTIDVADRRANFSFVGVCLNNLSDRVALYKVYLQSCKDYLLTSPKLNLAEYVLKSVQSVLRTCLWESNIPTERLYNFSFDFLNISDNSLMIRKHPYQEIVVPEFPELMDLLCIHKMQCVSNQERYLVEEPTICTLLQDIKILEQECVNNTKSSN